MIKTEISGELNLKTIYGNDLVEDIASATAARVGNEFAYYIKKNRFNSLFENQTGKTLDSIGVYRKTGRKPTFVIKAGLNIKGSLNYLAGLYRGQSVSRSGKKFSYYKPRDLIVPSWQSFGGDKRLNDVFQIILEKRIKEVM